MEGVVHPIPLLPSLMRIIALVLGGVCAGSALFFSWLPHPQLGQQVLMPQFLADWVDAPAHQNARTAVPFLLWGAVAGLRLSERQAGPKAWIFHMLLMVFVACLAELGQLFLPARTCDLGDIGWAAAGAGAGLALALGVGRLYQKLRGAGGRSCSVIPCPPADKLNDRS
jgi:hypothetical protein